MSGIILFLNAGDPGFDMLARVVRALDDAGVDWLELAVPFPNSVTDGPTIRRSARRALDAGADLDATLAACSDVGRRRLKIALLADWRYTVRSLELDGFAWRDFNDTGATAEGSAWDAAAIRHSVACPRSA